MVVWIKDNEIEIFDESRCPGCSAHDTLYFSACTAPECNSWGCTVCGWGCDYDFAEKGRCSQAFAEAGQVPPPHWWEMVATWIGPSARSAPLSPPRSLPSPGRPAGPGPAGP